MWEQTIFFVTCLKRVCCFCVASLCCVQSCDVCLVTVRSCSVKHAAQDEIRPSLSRARCDFTYKLTLNIKPGHRGEPMHIIGPTYWEHRRTYPELWHREVIWSVWLDQLRLNCITDLLEAQAWLPPCFVRLYKAWFPWSKCVHGDI